jgi:hypothetical protein
MARLTRSEIVKLLLAGSAIPWADINKKNLKLELADARQRRLFSFLLKSKIRKPSELPSQFVAGLPEGYKVKVRAMPLTVLGRASAMTNGRAADGTVDMSELETGQREPIVLKNHSAFRLTTRTLEPVARVHDILLTKEAGEPSSKSLVVALSDTRILARRFEISENQDDIAVLVAHPSRRASQLPDGQITSAVVFTLSSPFRKNISVFPKSKSEYMIRRPASSEGRFAIVTDARRDAVDADAPITNGA